MRRISIWTAVLAAAVVVATAASAASGSVGKRVFYLTVHTRQCLIGTTKANAKTVELVPCSNGSHNLEVYATGHGGWGHSTPPPSNTALGIARAFCLSSFARLTGHALPSTRGWQGFWPSPGAETARYGDRIICSYRTWPRLAALGSGWHVGK
jgi:hypothetical protein